MALLNKNPNESAYVGGKKHWLDVIKNTDTTGAFIWRQPEEDFNTNSTLIVMPGEEAVFIKDGKIQQVFQSGTYKLSTQNYPFISRITNAFSGGISSFNCVVFFVRKADSREIKWGTDSPIQVRDKIWGIRTEARVRGVYKVRVVDSTKLLIRMVSAGKRYLTQEEILLYFDNEFAGKIKAVVSDFLNNIQTELIGIESHLNDISSFVQPIIDRKLQEYGLACVNFSIAGITIDTSKYDALDTAQINSLNKIRNAQSDKTVMDVLGQNWERQQAVNIMSDMANNSGSGATGTIGAGIGMGMVSAQMFGDMSNQILNVRDEKNKEIDKTDPVETLSKLKQLLDMNLITQEEYEEKKRGVLTRL